jgi:predicted site-specific integrase-resolvase
MPAPDGKPDNWLDRNQLAKHWSISTKTLERWLKYGRIPEPINMCGHLLWPVSTKDYFKKSRA